MADDSSIRGPADRNRVNLNEDWELKYWAKELSASADELRAAVKAVGTSVEDVRARLQS
jgi:hypothetical protein